MSDASATGRYLRLSVDVMVEVLDVEALRAAALAEIRKPEAELDDAERQEHIDLVNADETGASALQWLIEPDDVLGLVERIRAVEPREAMVSVEPSDGILDEGDEQHYDGPDDHLL